jgi:hypothetical protein
MTKFVILAMTKFVRVNRLTDHPERNRFKVTAAAFGFGKLSQ